MSAFPQVETGHQGARELGMGVAGPPTRTTDVLQDRLGAARVLRIQLLSGDPNGLISVRTSGAIYAFEILNYIDGKRTVADIRDAVSAELPPVTLAAAADYLQACEEARIITLN
jgi:hypothetical protein